MLGTHSMMRDWEQDYLDNNTPWDKGKPAPPLIEWIEKNPGVLSGDILVPGCGLGHDVRALEEKTSGTTITGIDVSPTAIAQADAINKVGNERYLVADLFDLKHLAGSFDYVWEHTCFCAINPVLRDVYVLSVWEALAPGGNLLGVFYLNPYDEDHQPGGGPPHGTTKEELDQRFVKSNKFEIIEEYLPQRSYDGREGRELMLRMRRV